MTSYFDVSHPDEAPDMPDLATALPTELARRLSANPSFAVRNANRLTVLPQATISEPATGWNTVREIGRREDAQFVVSGRVLSTAVTGKGLRPTLFESNNTSQQGAYYTGPFAGLLGGAIKYQPTERQFDTELWVYDALTGALLANERISELGQGDVMPRPVLPFASAGFWQTDYGRAVDRALQRVTQRVADVIGCIPFSARVARVESGNRVYINAGGLDGLSPGDRLLLYKPLSSSTIRAAGNGRELGIPESLSGDVSVIQVQPNFSIGIANRARLRVEEGDYLRLVPHR
ncbi:flagella assembly protein FlgT middle domain-containing protein [Paludibacterium denitrificans]|uniref:flagella assembly protein FlgT middle domain-containing protein n=1 Tax=Paludibacterium denitrificans TaxID=2675226 RepID=UPI001E658203|nr:flagella assembly protein FlgT middle domain-containing protein [Paludibacterium denitrificans]